MAGLGQRLIVDSMMIRTRWKTMARKSGTTKLFGNKTLLDGAFNLLNASVSSHVQDTIVGEQYESIYNNRGMNRVHQGLENAAKTYDNKGVRIRFALPPRAYAEVFQSKTIEPPVKRRYH